MTRLSALLLACTMPLPAAAHPHVFVETDLTFVVNAAGEVTGAEVTWTYDPFFSMLILEDMGLDADADGTLDAAERKALLGFDLATWPEGFEGDLYLDAAGRKIELGHPESTFADVLDGQIVTRHVRSVPDVPAGDATFRQYDPTYYVAYTLGSVTASGWCAAKVEAPEPDAGETALAEAFTSYSEDEFQVLELGVHYADTIRLTCPPPS